MINEATIRCLIEEGFAGTTTSAVCARAGISRGALTHHFATKQDMMLAAVQHLADVRNRELAGTVNEFTREPDRAREVIELFWTSFKSDLFYASLELWNAARIDPALLEELTVAERELGGRHRRLARELFGDAMAQSKGFDSALDMLFRVMRGAALTRMIRRDPDLEDHFIDDWAQMFTRALLP